MHPVQQPADFHALQAAYAARWRAGTPGTFEVRILPGAPVTPGWSLAPDPADAHRPVALDVVIRGPEGSEGAAPLAVPDAIRARRLTLEGVQLVASHRTARFVVAEALTWRGVQVLDGRGASLDGHGALLVVEAWAPAGTTPPAPVEARFEDCWFARNFADPRGMALLTVGVAEGAPAWWSRVSLSDVTFLGNVLAADLRLEGVAEARLDRVLWHRDRADGVLLESIGSGPVTLQHSLLVLADRGQVARLAAESPPVLLGEGVQVLAPAGPTPLSQTQGRPAVRLRAEDARAAAVGELVGAFQAPLDRAAAAPRVRALLGR